MADKTIRQRRRASGGMRQKHLIAWCTEEQHAAIKAYAKSQNATMGATIITLIGEALRARKAGQ